MNVSLMCGAAVENEYFEDDPVQPESPTHKYLLKGVLGRHKIPNKGINIEYDKGDFMKKA